MSDEKKKGAKSVAQISLATPTKGRPGDIVDGEFDTTVRHHGDLGPPTDPGVEGPFTTEGWEGNLDEIDDADLEEVGDDDSNEGIIEHKNLPEKVDEARSVEDVAKELAAKAASKRPKMKMVIATEPSEEDRRKAQERRSLINKARAPDKTPPAEPKLDDPSMLSIPEPEPPLYDTEHPPLEPTEEIQMPSSNGEDFDSLPAKEFLDFGLPAPTPPGLRWVRQQIPKEVERLRAEEPANLAISPEFETDINQARRNRAPAMDAVPASERPTPPAPPPRGTKPGSPPNHQTPATMAGIEETMDKPIDKIEMERRKSKRSTALGCFLTIAAFLIVGGLAVIFLILGHNKTGSWNSLATAEPTTPITWSEVAVDPPTPSEEMIAWNGVLTLYGEEIPVRYTYERDGEEGVPHATMHLGKGEEMISIYDFGPDGEIDSVWIHFVDMRIRTASDFEGLSAKILMAQFQTTWDDAMDMIQVDINGTTMEVASVEPAERPEPTPPEPTNETRNTKPPEPPKDDPWAAFRD